MRLKLGRSAALLVLLLLVFTAGGQAAMRFSAVVTSNGLDLAFLDYANPTVSDLWGIYTQRAIAKVEVENAEPVTRYFYFKMKGYLTRPGESRREVGTLRFQSFAIAPNSKLSWSLTAGSLGTSFTLDEFLSDVSGAMTDLKSYYRKLLGYAGDFNLKVVNTYDNSVFGREDLKRIIADRRFPQGTYEVVFELYASDTNTTSWSTWPLVSSKTTLFDIKNMVPTTIAPKGTGLSVRPSVFEVNMPAMARQLTHLNATVELSRQDTGAVVWSSPVTRIDSSYSEKRFTIPFPGSEAAPVVGGPTYTWKLNVKDPANQQVADISETFSLYNSLPRPRITLRPSGNIRVGESFTFTGSVTDTEDQLLGKTTSLAWYVTPPGAAAPLAPVKGASLTQLFDTAGIYQIELRATDYGDGIVGQTASEIIRVTADANRPPHFSMAPHIVSVLRNNQTLTSVPRYRVGDVLNLEATAIDDDGDPVTVLWRSRGIVFGTGTTAKLTLAQAGTYDIAVTASDNRVPAGSVTEQMAAVTALPLDAPKVTITSPAQGQRVVVGDVITLAATADDVDDGSLPVTWFGPDGAAISGNTYTIGQSGSLTLKAQAANSAKQIGTATVAVNAVANSNPVVSLNAPAKYQWAPGESLTLTATASDPDPGQTVVYEWQLDGVTQPATGNSFTVAFNASQTGANGAYRSHTIKVTVRDRDTSGTRLRGGSAAQEVSVFVGTPIPENQPPTITSTGWQFADAGRSGSPVVGDMIRLNAQATDPDRDPVTLAWMINGTNIGSGTGLDYRLVQSADNVFTVVANDGRGGSVRTDLRVTVGQNNPPVITLDPIRTGILVGDTVTFRATATDPEGHNPVQLVWLQSGSQLAVGNTYTHTFTRTGPHRFTVQATDARGAVATRDVEVARVDANQPPTLSLNVTPARVRLDAAGRAVVTATVSGKSDPEGRTPLSAVTWTVDGVKQAFNTDTATITFTSVGTHTVLATIADDAGNTGGASATVTTYANSAPQVGVTQPAPGGTIQAVRLDTGDSQASLLLEATASDSDNDPVTLNWTVSVAGSQVFSGTGNRLPVTVTNRSGAVQVTVVATDGQGGRTQVTSSAVILAAPEPVNTPPTIDSIAVTYVNTADGTLVPGSIINVKVGKALRFSVAARDVDRNDSVSVGWLEGSVSRGTGSTFTATYQRPGDYTIKAVATDSKGAAAQTQVVVRVVNNPPVVSITAPQGTLVAKTNANLQATATDPDGQPVSVTWLLGNTPVAQGAATTFQFPVAGAYSLTAQATDSLGATANASVQVQVAPNQPPTLNLAATPARVRLGTDGKATVTATVSGKSDPEGTALSSVTWLLDGVRLNMNTDSATLELSSVGTHTITATITDAVGNVGSASAMVTVYANTAPQVGITQPAAGSVIQAIRLGSGGNQANLQLEATTSDRDNDPVTLNWTVSVNGAQVFTGPGNTLPVVLTDTTGAVQITVTATDGHGGQSVATSSSMIMPPVNNAPTLSAVTVTYEDGTPVGTPMTVQVGKAVRFAVTPADIDRNDTVSVVWMEGTAGRSTGSTFTTTYQQPGDYTLKAVATDSKGATAQSAVTIHVVNNPPTISITAPGADPLVARTYTTLQATAADVDNQPVNVTWWLGNVQVAQGAQTTYRFAAAGQYTLIARATDSLGSSTDASADIDVVEPAPQINLPPTLALAVSSGRVRLNAAGTASVTATVSAKADPEGDAVSGVTWTLDGVTQPVQTDEATLEVSSAGSHTIIATITDAAGNTGSASATVEVYANSAPQVGVVQPAPDATIQAIRSATGGTQASLVLEAAATDSDNDAVTLTWNVTAGSKSVFTGTGNNLPVTLQDVTGTVQILVTADDGQGGKTQTSTTVVIVPLNNAPTLNAISVVYADPVTDGTPDAGPPVTVKAGKAVEFSVAATDSDPNDTVSVVWMEDSATVGSGSSFSVTYSEPGDHTIVALATDSAGATVQTEMAMRVVNEPPVVSITNPGDVPVETGVPVALQATVSDPENQPVTVTWLINDAPVADGAEAAYQFDAEGTYTLTARATDSLGSTSDATVQVQVVQAAVNQPPTLTLAVSADRVRLGMDGTATVTATVTAKSDPEGGELSNITWLLDGVQQPVTADVADLVISGAGSHTIIATVSDNVGNPGGASAAVEAYGNTAPQVGVVQPAPGGTIQAVLLDTGASQANLVLEATATDNEEDPVTLNWVVAAGDVQVYAGTGNNLAVPLTDVTGTVQVTVTADDGQGGQAVATSTAVILPPSVTQNNAPTLGAIDVTYTNGSDGAPVAGPPVTVKVGKALQFAVTATDADVNDNVSVVWLENGVALGTGSAFELTYSDIGDHTLMAIATDAAGATAQSSLVIRVVNEPPTVSITAPRGTPVEVNTEVSLTAQVSDPENQPVTVTWYLDNTMPVAIGADTTFRFNSVGEHTLTAQASDSFGDSSAVSVQLQVVEPEAASGLTAAIVEPQPDLVTYTDQSIRFRAVNIPTTAQVAWTSDQIGTISTNALDTRDFESTLPEGRHMVTLTVNGVEVDARWVYVHAPLKPTIGRIISFHGPSPTLVRNNQPTILSGNKKNIDVYDGDILELNAGEWVRVHLIGHGETLYQVPPGGASQWWALPALPGVLSPAGPPPTLLSGSSNNYPAP